MAKLFAADYWIVLDDVQFARRDYQHRARLADLKDPSSQRWLTVPTHLRDGRSTLIRDAVIDAVAPFRPPTAGIWSSGHRLSALWALAVLGPDALAARFQPLPSADSGPSEASSSHVRAPRPRAINPGRSLSHA